VTVDAKEIGLNDTVSLSIKMSGDFDDLVEPSSENFNIVSRQQSTNISIINGVMKQERILSLILAPLTTGDLKISEAQLIKNGKVVAKSQPVTIRVSGQEKKLIPKQQPQFQMQIQQFPQMQIPRQVIPQEEQEEKEPEQAPLTAESMKDLQKMAGKPFFIKVSFPDRKIYVGEPFVISFDLYIRTNIVVSGARLVKSPTFEGFITEDLISQKKGRVHKRAIGRYIYEIHPQMKLLLIAIKPENILIDSLAMDILSGGFFNERANRVASPVFTLNITPVPEENRPAAYRDGHIGIFTIASSLARSNILSGDKGILTVEVNGTGNLAGIKSPQLKPVSGLLFELIPGKDLDELQKDEGGISGKRVFQYLISPQNKGEYAIPPVELIFFNPMTSKFEKTVSQELKLLVTGEKVVPVMKDDEKTGRGEIASIIWDSDLGTDGSEKKDSLPSVLDITDRPFVFIMILPLAVMLLAEGSFRYRKYMVRNFDRIKTQNAFSFARKGIKNLSRKAGREEISDFYGSVEKIIEEYLTDKLKIPVNGLTLSRLREILISSGVKDADSDSVVKELENCSFARFAPSELQQAEIQNCLERVEKMLLSLEKTEFKIWKNLP
jgi:hypothetical protein